MELTWAVARRLTTPRCIQRANTIVFGIFFSDEETGDSRMESRRKELPKVGASSVQGRLTLARKVLQRITEETGGHLFEVGGNQTIDQIYSTIEEELRTQYSFGYSSDSVGDSLEYRTIRVRTTKPNLIVQARDGYYAK